MNYENRFDRTNRVRFRFYPTSSLLIICIASWPRLLFVHVVSDWPPFFESPSYQPLTPPSQYPEAQAYFISPRPYDSIHPLSKLVPFTTHSSTTRRLGVSTVLKNTSFHLPSHPTLLSPEPSGVNVLPYLLLPLAGPEELTLEENSQLLPDLQFLPPDKKREEDLGIVITLLETLLLLTTERDGRERLREAGTYFVVRECHAEVEDDGVREVCERLVQVLMRDEAPEQGGKAEEKDEEEDDDEEIVEVF
jgi:hypothetical protein